MCPLQLPGRRFDCRQHLGVPCALSPTRPIQIGLHRSAGRSCIARGLDVHRDTFHVDAESQCGGSWYLGMMATVGLAPIVGRTSCTTAPSTTPGPSSVRWQRVIRTRIRRASQTADCSIRRASQPLGSFGEPSSSFEACCSLCEAVAGSRGSATAAAPPVPSPMPTEANNRSTIRTMQPSSSAMRTVPTAPPRIRKPGRSSALVVKREESSADVKPTDKSSKRSSSGRTFASRPLEPRLAHWKRAERDATDRRGPRIVIYPQDSTYQSTMCGNQNLPTVACGWRNSHTVYKPQCKPRCGRRQASVCGASSGWTRQSQEEGKYIMASASPVGLMLAVPSAVFNGSSLASPSSSPQRSCILSSSTSTSPLGCNCPRSSSFHSSAHPLSAVVLPSWCARWFAVCGRELSLVCRRLIHRPLYRPRSVGRHRDPRRLPVGNAGAAAGKHDCEQLAAQHRGVRTLVGGRHRYRKVPGYRQQGCHRAQRTGRAH